MSDPSSLRVAVVSTESSPISNRLWYATKAHLADLLVIAPEGDETDIPDFQVGLPYRYLSKHEHVYRRLIGMSRELDQFNPDIVHINSEPWGLASLLEFARRPGVILHGAENQFFTDGLKPVVRYGITQLVASQLAGYASWNIEGAAAVHRMSPELPTHVAPAIIPPPHFVPSSWHGSVAPFEILLIGRLDKEKGFDRVIKAVALLNSKENYRITICGSGPEKENLSQLAAHGQVQLHFAGHVSADDLAQRIAGASVLVQPSITTRPWAEQFGRSVAEAMTVGLPCITSQSGELPNVVGDPWCTFPEDDCQVLADKLEMLRTHPSELSRLSEQQAARATRWAPAPASKAMAEFWGRAHDHQKSKGGRRQQLQRELLSRVLPK